MSDGQLTAWLQAWSQGDRDAEAELLEAVYQRLKRMARRCLSGRAPDATLEPTSLVHETYLRLIHQNKVDWKNRVHFLSIAARMMRRILLDHLKSRQRLKRGGGAVQISLDSLGPVAVECRAEITDLEDALRSLAAIDPTKAAIIEMRFFGGLKVQEIAEALSFSTANVYRHWQLAKAWLVRELLRDS